MGDRIAVMSEARLQQVGSPQELYDHPVNRFVAGFIGSPSMNFIDVDGTARTASIRLVGDDIDIPLPERSRRRSKDFSGDKLTVGVRPEHLDVNTGGTCRHVRAARRRGRVPGQRGAHPPRRRWPRHRGAHRQRAPPPAGRRPVARRSPLEKVHLFDPESQLALEKERRTEDMRTGGTARRENPSRRPSRQRVGPGRPTVLSSAHRVGGLSPRGQCRPRFVRGAASRGGAARP